MSKKLAIIGHPTRGKEVIELLEVLGGKNTYGYTGDMESLYFSIYNDAIIYGSDRSFLNDNYVFFTLEEFLEKYPYKVGDRVLIPEYESEVRIYDMDWSYEDIQYLVYRNDDAEWYTADELKNWNDDFYDAETEVESTGYMQMGKTVAVIFNEANYEDEVELKLGNYEIEVRDGKTYAVKKKPVYPKTYAECCEVLNKESTYALCGLPEDEYPLFDKLIELKRCRDAYWKIAGEQMGLGKPWDINYGCGEWGYWIGYSINENKIYLQDSRILINHTLVFPTKEMRDTFYENFKDLIEKCKEIL